METKVSQWKGISKAEYLVSRGWDFIGMDGGRKMWRSRRPEFGGKLISQGLAVDLQRKADGVDLVDGKKLTNDDILKLVGKLKRKSALVAI